MAGSQETQLLELLQRAADELKAAQRETHEVTQALEAERARVAELEARLSKHEPPGLGGPAEKTSVVEVPANLRRTDPMGTVRQRLTTPPMSPAPREERTNVTQMGDVVEARLAQLQEELDAANLAAEEARGRADDAAVFIDRLEGEKANLEQKLAQAQAPEREGELRAQLTHAESELARFRHEIYVQTSASDSARAELIDLQRLDSEHREMLNLAEARLHLQERELAELKGHQVSGEELLEARAALARLQEEHQALEADDATLRDELAQAQAQHREAIAALEAQVAALRAEAEAARGSREQLERDAHSLAAQVSMTGDVGRKVSQLEHEVASLRARRDELNVEVARADAERKSATTRLQDAEARLAHAAEAEAARHAELESQLAKEKEKVQLTAQRLLDARNRTRELEPELEAARAALATAAREREALEESHRLAMAHHLDAAAQQLDAREEESKLAIAQLQSHVREREAELQRVTEQWRAVEKQYEALHRELLEVLDQRDEARRQLAAR
jgi:chromosome segregation ATPase